MKIRPLWLVGSVLLLSIPLMGAKCTATAKAGVSCTSRRCTKSASIGVQESWPLFQGAPMGVHTNVASSFDAALYSVDVSQSTVTVPQQGDVTIELMDSSTGAVLATSTFAWTRTGTTIRLADPGAVNAWAQQDGSNADAVKYQMAQFQTSQHEGLNTLTMTDAYDGTVEASASTTWRGPPCPIPETSKTGGVQPDMRNCRPSGP